MSGWIKLEKDLATDPRVIRIGKALDRKFSFFAPEGASRDGTFDPSNATPLPGVTLAVGALALLWIYADSHARNDDTLDLGVTDLDELLGIPGFCSLMPSDWLTVIDEHTVELPGFQSHNGVEAKNKDLNAKRQQRHREKVKRNTVTGRNAQPLPDQDQDQDQDQTITKRERAQPAKDGRRPAEGNGETPDPHALVEAIRAVYPAGTYGQQNWILAERELSKLLDGGESADELLAHARAFAAQMLAKGSTGTQFIRSPEKFFGDGFWRGPFPIPVSGKPASASLTWRPDPDEERRFAELKLAPGAA